MIAASEFQEKCLRIINEMSENGEPVTADFAVLSCVAAGHVHTIDATRWFAGHCRRGVRRYSAPP